MSHLRFAFCCLFVLVGGQPAAAAETALEYSFAAGDEHHYEMKQDMKMNMSMGGGQQNIATNVQQTMDMTWKVDKVDEQGLATVLQSVDRVRMDMQAPGQPEMKYDTDSDEPPAGFAAMLAPLFKAMTAEPYTVTMTPRGEIKSLELSESFTKAMKSLPGAAMMGDMFSDEGFRNMVQQNALVLPKQQDLKPGHEWTNKAEMKNAAFGVMKTETTYRYVGSREVKGEQLEAFAIEMKIDFGGAGGIANFDVTAQEAKGEILFNRGKGRLESSNLKQTMTMNVNAAGQAMTQQIDQDMTFKRVNKKAKDTK